PFLPEELAERGHLVGGSVERRERLEVHEGRERPRDVVRAKAVPTIGSVGQPVSEEQHLHADTDVSSSRRLTTVAGTPAAIARSGSGLVTTAPAPTMVSRPTSASTTALLPIQLPAPMRTGRSDPGWS